MQVTVKLFATLVRVVPGVRAGEPFGQALAEGGTVADLARSLGLPTGEIRLVFVNGLAKDLDQQLNEGDEVGIFPPIGGGN
jgi:sulfur-carrier protein